MFKNYFKKLIKEVLEDITNNQISNTPIGVCSPQNNSSDLYQRIYDLDEQLRALARSQGKWIVRYGVEDIKKSEQTVER